ncbi:hypothetical protein CDD83_803 [Cordyceps sp. RAO-2017]|nr:hypothetical protein CDD83_803 [Cordyceps sp. RAO-2017]
MTPPFGLPTRTCPPSPSPLRRVIAIPPPQLLAARTSCRFPPRSTALRLPTDSHARRLSRICPCALSPPSPPPASPTASRAGRSPFSAEPIAPGQTLEPASTGPGRISPTGRARRAAD